MSDAVIPVAALVDGERIYVEATYDPDTRMLSWPTVPGATDYEVPAAAVDELAHQADEAEQ